MKAKVSTPQTDARYKPIDEETYPEEIAVEGFEYHRFYCRIHFIVYEKYRNGVKLGYLIFPGSKEIFSFQMMIEYVESIKSTETLCKSYLLK